MTPRGSHPRPAKRGDPIRGDDLNRVIDALAGRITVGDGLALRRTGSGLSIELLPTSPYHKPVRQFQVQSETTDHVVCKALDTAAGVGSVNYLVMKPPALRGSTTGAYTNGDTIYAELADVVLSAGGTDTRWVDLNVDAKDDSTRVSAKWTLNASDANALSISPTVSLQSLDLTWASEVRNVGAGFQLNGDFFEVLAPANGKDVLVCWSIALGLLAGSNLTEFPAMRGGLYQNATPTDLILCETTRSGPALTSTLGAHDHTHDDKGDQDEWTKTIHGSDVIVPSTGDLLYLGIQQRNENFVSLKVENTHTWISFRVLN